ncbi:MAG: multicopper oxidase domain-containing protein, partial [Actinomycetales bacterium]
RTKFADFTGRSVYHCHILFHEDHGMMGIFDIVDEDGTGPGPDQLLPTDGLMHQH